MKSLFAALQFLTVVPLKLKRISAGDMAWATAYFPAIGLCLGLLLAAANLLLSSMQFGPFVSNSMLVIFLLILTGALHLDGLADCADALASGKDRTEMLKIMRDPHVGTMGVLALVSVLLLKISFLSSISPETKGTALILMCVLSRWSMAMTIFLFPYARTEGKAKLFIDGIDKKIFLMATLSALVIVSIVSRAAGIVLLAVTAAFSYISGLIISKKIGGITGDAIGAISESAEVVILLSITLLERSVL
ncbi:MAG: adenosylcobinamide-GDP ribazoletransferase [Candidatus Omnitrophica bacterium]|nr:adenosylcobinamide-GDP ribazoletransferase [Candidatus Omnitrophota bacterium]